jgi:hypothetical protein
MGILRDFVIVVVTVGIVACIRVDLVTGEEVVVDDWECDSNGWHAAAIRRRGVGLGDRDERRIRRDEEKGEEAEAQAAAAEERIFGRIGKGGMGFGWLR